MAGDGIYSRYLTEYFGAGRYSLQLRVHDNENSAFTLNIPQNETKTPQCCGSVISSDPKDRIPTGAFTRTTKGPVIHLLSVPPSDVDLMPPAAIRDLKIEVQPKSGQLVASWTAPGDDFDIGTVTGYRFVIAENYSSLLDPMLDVQTLLGFQQPDLAGVSTSYQFGLARIDEHYNKDIFLGILAFDEKDNEASMSNIVTLHLTSDGEYSNTVVNQPINQPINYHGQHDQSISIGSISGAILMLSIVLWFAIWYIRNQRGSFKGTKHTVEIGLVTETESSTPPSTIQRESETLKRHLMYQVPQGSNQSGSTENESQDNPMNSAPIYWSASQLLDNNNLVHNRGVNATLDPISEEETMENTLEDEEVYARGLANYGLQTQSQLRHIHQQIHEPIYVAYSPDEQTIYGTGSRQQKKKVPPKVPPKPSINALLGIGVVQPLPSRSNSTTEIYGSTKSSSSTRHISHV